MSSHGVLEITVICTDTCSKSFTISYANSILVLLTLQQTRLSRCFSSSLLWISPGNMFQIRTALLIW